MPRNCVRIDSDATKGVDQGPIPPNPFWRLETAMKRRSSHTARSRRAFNRRAAKTDRRNIMGPLRGGIRL